MARAASRKAGPWDRVLNWLAIKDRSEGEVRLRLREWGVKAEEADAILDRLTAKGYVDDTALADKIRDWHIRRNPVGPGLLLERLRKREIPADIASEAVVPLREKELQTRLIRRLIIKRLPALLPLPPESRIRRMRGFLSRRGFSAGLIRDLTAPLFREDAGPEDFEHDDDA